MGDKTQRWLRVGVTAPADQAGYSGWLRESVYMLTREMNRQVKESGGRVVTEPHFDVRLTLHQLVEIDSTEEAA